MKVIDLKLAPQYIPQLAQWHHKEWAHLSPPESSASTLIAQMSEYLTDAVIPKMFIGEEANQVTGSSSLIAEDMDSRTDLSPWLANVYVNASHRNKGLGKLLVKAVVDYAKALGLQKIYLFTADKADFYQTLGWSIISREDYKGGRVTIMEYELKDYSR